MKLATWNVNSVRARLERVLDWLKTRSPDVACLQEIKCVEDQFPRLEVEALGYQVELFGQKTYNGVAILSKGPITDVTRNMGDDDGHARLIAATVGGIRVVDCYAPNGQAVDSVAYRYKLGWYEKLAIFLAGQKSAGLPLLVCGDFNVAPHPIDVHDPAAWEGQTLFTEKERAAWEHVRQTHALVDLYRDKHPEPGKFTWWDYRMLGFPKNHGLRIDHILVDQTLAARCTSVEIDREARKGKQPSDHAPVIAEFSG